MRSAAFLDTEPNWLGKPSDVDEAGRGAVAVQHLHQLLAASTAEPPNGNV